AFRPHRKERFAVYMRVSATRLATLIIATLTSAAGLAEDKKEENPAQYQFEAITVPPASADEPKLQRVSVGKALNYLEHGALAWNGSRKCVTCHTNGTYMVIRPALTARVGAPNEEMRRHFVASLDQFLQKKPEEQQESVAPAQAIYMAA